MNWEVRRVVNKIGSDLSQAFQDIVDELVKRDVSKCGVSLPYHC